MATDRILSFAGILWFGCMGGFFWSFSVVVMSGLGLSEPATAVAAMQDINLAVRNPLFAIGFFGAVLIAAALLANSLFSARALNLASAAAALLYLGGVIAVTALGNVPMNEALASVDPGSPQAGPAMAEYLVDWTRLNHVRTVSAIGATVLLVWAFGRSARTES